MSAAPSAPGKVRAWVVVAAFAASLLGALWVPLTDEDRASVEDYLAALETSESQLEPGTVVFVQPPWRDDVLDAIEARGLPRGVSATTALAQPHGSFPSRVLLLADEAQPLPRALRSRLDAPGVAEATRRVAGVEVSLLDEGGGAEEGPAEDLADLLPEARVSVEDESGRRTACRWSPAEERHTCPGRPDWHYVGEVQKPIGGRSERCVWAHPITQGHVRVVFPDVELGRRLLFAHALADGAVRNGGAAVTTTVLVDGQRIGKSVRTNAPGFKEASFPIPADKRGTAGTLELDVTTPHDGARHYCFTARFAEAGS